MNLQLIDNKKLVFRINNQEYQFVKPNFLYKDFGILIKAKVKGSTMGWNIDRRFVSYNQLKKSIKIKQ